MADRSARRVIPPEDAWAYTAETRAAIRRARADIRAGRVLQLTYAQLEEIGRTGQLPGKSESGRTPKRRAP